MNILVRNLLIIVVLIQTVAVHVKAAPEITRETFDTFPEAVGGGFAYEKGKVYSVKGKIIQVGPDYVQVQSLVDDQPFGVIKITSEFLENFPGQRGTIVFFLSEFFGYANFNTKIGGSIRLAVFNASHYLQLDGGIVHVVDKELAEKVVALTTSSGVPSPSKTSNAEGDKPTKQDLNVDPKIRILGEWINEKKNPTTGELALKFKNIFKKDGVFELHFVLVSDNKTIVSNGKWTVTEGHIYVEYRFGNLENNPLVKREIIFRDAKSFVMTDQDGKESNELYTYQQGVKNDDADLSTNSDKPMKSDDGIKIKIAELKGELAGVNQKIEAERKRWLDASNVINKLTNNRTRPVIRNSPQHEMLYEAQVIMKEVEERAPDLKEQKARIEATLKELE